MTPSLLRAALALVLLSLAPTAMAGSPIEVQVEVPQAVVPVGQPLTLRLHVRNVSNQTVNMFGVFTGDFHRTHYFGIEEIGCLVSISVPTPAPGHPYPPPQFGFTWHFDTLAPGDSRSCELRFPFTFIPGTDTIPLYTIIGGIPELVTTFTYTLVVPRAPARPVPIGHPMLWLALAGLLGTTVRRRLR